MATKPKDILYDDYGVLESLNRKIRSILPIYFITDFGMIYGKSPMNYTEQFLVLSDEVELEYLTNIIIDGSEFYESAREVKKTGLYSSFKNSIYTISSVPREKKDGTIIVPDEIKIRQCPREMGSDFKKKFYKYLDKLDLFKLRSLNYIPLNDHELDAYANQYAIELIVDGIPLIIDNSLFPDSNKPGFRPELSVAHIPWDIMKNATEVDEDTAFFMLRNKLELYTTYMLLKVLIA